METTIKPITDEHWNKKSNNNNNNNKETRYTVVCAELHFKIYNETGVKLDKKTGLTMYQNQSKQYVRNDRTIPNNKLDIKIRDNKKVTCMLIDVAISGGRNMIKKEAEKILKYKDLIVEIQGMWNVKAKVIPVIIIWATGIISKSLRQDLSNTPGEHEIKELQIKQPYWSLHTYCGKC